MHDAYHIGHYWTQIPNHEQREKCGLCGQSETIEHILLECDKSITRQIVWKEAKDVWTRRETHWPEIDLGTTLGSSLIKFKDTHGKLVPGKARLLTILLTEAAYLIWKLCCEHVIQHGNDQNKLHTPDEIMNRWHRAINIRLKMDRLHTDTLKYGKRALKEKLILQTWSGVLHNEQDLPDNWIWAAGVLVGSTLHRPREQNR